MKSLLALLIILLAAANSFIIFGISQSTQQISIYTDLMLEMGKMQSEVSHNAEGISEIQSALKAIQRSAATIREEIKQIAFKPRPQPRKEQTFNIQKLQRQSRQGFHQVQFQEEFSDESPVFFEDSSSDMPFSGEKSPDEYWREIKRLASERKDFKFDRGKREQFLEEGAKLVQKLEECEMNYLIDSESLQFFEAKLEDEGINAINALYVAKKELAGYLSEAKQHRRELNAILENTQPMKLPKVQSYLPRPPQDKFYHLALADNRVLHDAEGNFLIRIRFYYKDKINGIITISQMNDTFNLKTMKSYGNFLYPDHFTRDMYALVRKAYRQQALTFEGGISTAKKQHFLNLISQ